MASHSFSSLKDMLKSSSPSSSSSSCSSSSSSSSSSTPQAEAEPIEETNGTNLAAMFDNQLSVENQSSSSVSFLDTFTPPVLSSSSSEDPSAVNPVEENPVEQIISSCGKNPVVSSKELNKYPNGRSWCVKSGGPWTSRNVFPPPISCLKSIKNGKPYAYMKFNEDDQRFVLEEIKIPNKDFMRASRSNGHLKLYFVVSDEEASEMEEEIERAESDDEQDSI